MILHPESHTDHVPPEILKWVMYKFHDKNEFFMETVEIPNGFSDVQSGLHGPIMGDAPVPEEKVTYDVREGRAYSSRLVFRPTRPTRQLTVIGGPYGEHLCVLYTAFAGPLTPKEPQDPTLEPGKREESEEFWSKHALSL